ncbi:MAG: thiamine diphosphokinase [Agathobacter sp.]|nr:thiamine diphosphokinase [Agathobacter sp.]
MNCLIVSGGKIDFDFAVNFIKEEKFDLIIAADSGMHFLYKAEIIPDIIVGDFDSVSGDVLEYYRSNHEIKIHQLNPVKDDTDTEYAIRQAVNMGADSISIIGGTGDRLDHVMGNISLLGIGIEENMEIFLVDSHNRIRLIDKPLVLSRRKQFGEYVSLIPYTSVVKNITLKGFKYPLEDYDMGGFNSLGISNEIKDENAYIDFSNGLLLVIESKD